MSTINYSIEQTLYTETATSKIYRFKIRMNVVGSSVYKIAYGEVTVDIAETFSITTAYLQQLWNESANEDGCPILETGQFDI